MARPVISLLTDFGTHDPFVGICKGVILRIAPDAQLVDLTHEVRPFAIRDGVILLRSALPYLPVGVHLGVVDPGVGTERRPIAIRTGRGDTLVGPDNGLLLPAAEALGGIVAAHLLADPRYRLDTVGGTFHGRDVFAPAAAHLAVGVSIEELGPGLAPADLVRIALPEPTISGGALRATVLSFDRFGNAQLAATRRDLERAVGPVAPRDWIVVRARRASHDVVWATTFGDARPGEGLLHEDSSGLIALAVNLGSAKERFTLALDDEVAIARA